ncbi:MAG: hypothetical protein ACM3QS_08440 [Bacteroidota bacterium]
MNPQYLLVIGAIILVGWFGFGILFNVRRGEGLIKWMQGGLPRIGAKSTFRWLGTSVAQLGIAQAKRPFRQLDILLVLAPRDVFWMVLVALMQGRRDTMIFRGALSTPPYLDLELADPTSWTGREALRQVARRNWDRQAYRGMQLMAPHGYLELAVSTLDRLSGLMDRFSAHYVRLSLRRSAPNIEIHVPFPDRKSVDAAGYFEALCQLAGATGERN